MRYIVALSGGLASAWCAGWALRTFPKKDVVLYFNDTKWEHPDLYRFLDDLEAYFNHPITRDSDGRSPEDLFHYNSALASDFMPFCSKVLKVKRMQKFFNDGDSLIFGIGIDEIKRKKRLIYAYQVASAKLKKTPKLMFPLISNQVTTYSVYDFIKGTGIEIPELYRLGFTHNNCSGGCVRSGKAQWSLLLDRLPDVYAERERVENDMRNKLGKDIHYLKDWTLTQLRDKIENQISFDFGDDFTGECIGICDTTN